MRLAGLVNFARQFTSTALAAQGKAAKPQKKASEVKEIIISWLISRNDLEGQKNKAISSVLQRGHKLQIRLENKNKKKGNIPLTSNDVEARSILLERVNALVEQAGGMKARDPEGTMQRRMMLYFKPKP